MKQNAITVQFIALDKEFQESSLSRSCSKFEYCLLFVCLTAAECIDVNVGDKFGRTALMYCILMDRLDCAEILCKAGANVNKKDDLNRTALHWAAQKVM